MPKDKILHHWCLYTQMEDFTPIYAKLAIKYLMASFYTTPIGITCIMNSPLGDIHKGKILRQPLKWCLNMVLVIMRYQYYITVLFLYTHYNSEYLCMIMLCYMYITCSNHNYLYLHIICIPSHSINL